MAFKVGEKVRYSKMRDAAEIVSGPHPSQGGVDRYLVRKADGNVSLIKVTELSTWDNRREAIAEAVHKTLFGRDIKHRSEYSLSKVNRVTDAVLAALGSGKGLLKSGDRIRILVAGLDLASVLQGEVLTVLDPDYYGDGRAFTTNAPNNPSRPCWYFTYESEGTGWERI